MKSLSNLKDYKLEKEEENEVRVDINKLRISQNLMKYKNDIIAVLKVLVEQYKMDYSNKGKDYSKIFSFKTSLNNNIHSDVI